MTEDEPRLSPSGLAAAIAAFCGRPDEFWARCPTVEMNTELFGLGNGGAAAHAAFWDWDLRLLKAIVRPWPEGWPSERNAR